jgi:hypothetical protein
MHQTYVYSGSDIHIFSQYHGPGLLSSDSKKTVYGYFTLVCQDIYIIIPCMLLYI